MTRKDYVLLAAEIAAQMEDGTPVLELRTTTIAILAREIAKAIERANPRFKAARFLAACKVKG